MARSTSALHRMAVIGGNGENSPAIDNINSNKGTPSPKKLIVRRLSTSTTKSLMSDTEMAFDSDTSNASITSTNSPRRSRKMWSEAEEACLISGVAKHGENWETILNDKEYIFNGRISKDLRVKYRHLIQSSNLNNNNIIFDIRTINEKVTEVFIGPDWPRAQWMSSENVDRFETLLSDFEKKIAVKQKLISRISPARTPSRYMSSLTINSAVKRTKNNSGESSQDENVGTPLKKTKKQANFGNLTSSPLSVRSTSSRKSSKIVGEDDHLLLVHSDLEDENDATEEYEIGSNSVIHLDENAEPQLSQSKASRCIIM